MLRKMAIGIYCLLLAGLSVEIAVRRWVMDQTPSQVSPGLVVTLLFINGWFIWRTSRPSGRVGSEDQNEKKLNH